MTKHAKYSASASQQWLNCPGSVGMRTLAPKQKQSEAAALGTAAHDLLETCMEQDLDAAEMVDRIVSIGVGLEKRQFIVDDNMADAVQVCLDTARRYQKDNPDHEIMLEQRVDISPLVAPDMFGTVDIRIAVPFDKLIMIDYKHGQGVPVEVEDNTQLIYYALGSALEDDFNFDTIEMVIVQPRCPHADGSVRTYTISTEDLMGWIPVLKKGQKAAEAAFKKIVKKGAPIPELVKAGSWCKFCPAEGICPARYKQILDVAMVDFTNLEEDEMAEPKVPVGGLTMEQRVNILKHGDMIKSYIDKVFSDSEALLDNGVEVPGWKLVNKRGRAKFNDEDSVVIEKLVSLGFDHDTITRTKLETLSNLRKECGKDVIQDLTHIPDTGTTIARESDKRPAVQPSVHTDFESFDD